MIFVDANVPMYIVGGPSPNKDRANALVDQLRSAGEGFVTDVEVYQELLHRYSSIRRYDLIDAAFVALDEILEGGRTYRFGMSEIRDARELLRSVPGISARDAIHVAVMRSKGISRILSFDQGMDACPGVERIS